VSERPFGLETEFAFAAFGHRGVRLVQNRVLSQLMELAQRQHAWLPGKGGSGIWLANGSRLYIDCHKPELATPECTTPWEVCRYVRAGERLLAGLADEMCQRHSEIQQILLSAVNVSYGSASTTWASHESYGHRGDPSAFPAQFIPHFVSRLIYTGAGGFDNLSAGLEFLLSPRVVHLKRSQSPHSTTDRGIFHTKDESLSSAGWSRLHVLCGESLCSDTGLWLRVGTTAILVALCEAGLKPAAGVELSQPLAAMRTFAADVQLTATVPTSSGRQVSAVDIQRHLLDQARAHQSDHFMPEWAPEVCRRWGEMLDRLEQGAAAVERTLDWAIKQSLFRQHARRRGISWDSLPTWNHVLNMLYAVLLHTTNENDDGPRPILTPETVTSRGPVAEKLEELAPVLNRHGLDRNDLSAVLMLHDELHEIDTRFAQCNGPGIFSSLESAGVLDHHLPRVDRIEPAVTHPPQVGRARLRGESIARLSGHNGRYVCGWSAVWDLHHRRYLDLSDPLTDRDEWQDLPPAETDIGRIWNSQFQHVLSQVLDDYDRGCYEQAAARLASLEPLQNRSSSFLRNNYLRLTAWVQARRGFEDGWQALDQMSRQPAGDPDRLSLGTICDYVCVARYQGLVPPALIDEWLRRGLERIEQETDHGQSAAATFLGHYAYTLLRRGQPVKALAILEQACQRNRFDSAHPHTQSRLMCERGDAHRMLGQIDQSQHCLHEAERLHTAHNFEGDLADFTFTCQAKLAVASDDIPGARELLARARTIQSRLENPLGEIRTLLLEARLPSHRRTASRPRAAVRHRHRIMQLSTDRPALVHCERLKTILDHWPQWIGGEMLPGEKDHFWCL